MLAPLREAYYFFRHNFSALSRIMMPFLAIIVIMGLVTNLLAPSNVALAYLDSAVSLALYAYFMGKLITYLHTKVTEGRDISAEPIPVSSALWSSLLLGYMVHLAATIFGLFFFILPAIWLFVKLAFIDFNIVCKKVSVFEACRLSFEQTDDNKLAILIGVIFIAAPFLAAMMLMVQLAAMTTLDAVILPVVNALNMGLNILTTIFLFRHFTLANAEYD